VTQSKIYRSQRPRVGIPDHNRADHDSDDNGAPNGGDGIQ
jgi:hypothetical protein